MWGCFSYRQRKRDIRLVFPTHVGMFLGHVELDFHPFGLPHACGGVSMLTKDGMVIFESSPRMWGCFFQCSRP